MKGVRWVIHTARIGEITAYTILDRHPEGKEYLGDLGVDGRISPW
jgi:hypothetical protein